jgi:hypothetical protein
MTKMTKTVAAAVSIILAAGTASIAASAAASGPTSTPTIQPTAAAASDYPNPSLSPLSGDATLEDVESNGPPKGGKISTDDPDLEEGYVDPLTPILPTVTLSGTMDGALFKGVVRVNSTDANVETTRVQVCMQLSVLLANGSTRNISDCPFELHALEIAAGDNQTIGVLIDTTNFVERWNVPGMELGDSTVDGISRTLTFSVHPTYNDSQFGETGFSGNSINLTF